MSYRFVNTAAAIVLLALAGCGDLDFANPNAPIIEDVPTQSVVTGIEAGMRQEMDVYLRCVSSIGREAYYFETADPRYTRELLRGTPDPGGFLINRPWGLRYLVVANCNELMERAAGESNAQTRAGLEGFAMTMKAHQLLMNLNYMGSNGIKIETGDDVNIPFVPEQAALTEIARLLDQGHTKLQTAGNAFSFVLSSGFLGYDTPANFAKFNRALRARVAVYDGEFQTALTALQGSFLNATGSLDAGVYHIYGAGLGDVLNPLYEVPTSPVIKLMAHPSFRANAEAGDKRFSGKVFTRSSSYTFDNLSSDMAIVLAISSTDPFPIIRNEELILLRAEAYIGLGNFGAAQADINIVRAAAGLAPVALNANNALNQLLHEKRYSLFMEGHRWIDMRRYNRLNQLPKDREGDVILDKMPKPESEIPG